MLIVSSSMPEGPKNVHVVLVRFFLRFTLSPSWVSLDHRIRFRIYDRKSSR